MSWQRQLLGAVTLGVVLLGGYYLWRLADGDETGPALRVTLRFDDAAGLRAGSAIRYRGVEVGEVESIALAEDTRSVLIRCRMAPDVEPAVRRNSCFWVVRPRFRGVTEGATGLETLIRDPYLTFVTPDPAGPPLTPTDIIDGLLAPPDPKADVELAGAAEPGDLEFTVVFPENRGLRPGDYVRYRGMPVGLVDSVTLGESGVEVRARIRRQYRSTVQIGSQFWIARPEMSAGWTGVRIHELSGILEGAHLAYHSPEGASQAPATDGHIFWGEPERPDLDWDEQNGTTTSAPALEDGHPVASAVARIHYAFSEEDTWSPNDHYHFEVPGIVWVGADGNGYAAATSRGLDGASRVEDAMGDPEIIDEEWRVEFADGSVVPADVVDRGPLLTILRLARVPAFETPPPLDFESTSETGSVEAIGLDDSGQWNRIESQLDGGGVTDAIYVYSVIVNESSAIGFVATERTLIPLSEVPDAFRPGQ